MSKQRKGRQVIGRGDYILSTDRRIFVKSGLQEISHSTDHRLILAVLYGKGELQNCCYQWVKTCWPIWLKEIRPQTEGGGAAFTFLKGEVSRLPWSTKVFVS